MEMGWLSYHARSAGTKHKEVFHGRSELSFRSRFAAGLQVRGCRTGSDNTGMVMESHAEGRISCAAVDSADVQELVL